MTPARLARLCAAAIALQCLPAHAGEVVLDLDAALARADQSAPPILAARGRLGEAAAGRIDAAVRFPDNPELSVEAGPRFADRTSADLAIQLGQSLAPPGRRGARLAVADAVIAQAGAAAQAAALDVRREVALAFFAALHADRVIELDRTAEGLAIRAADAADRRRAAGEITDLEANLARAAAARSRSRLRAAEAERADAVGVLAALVGLAPDDAVVLRGELRGPAPRLDGAAIDRRADVVALGAEAAIAGAEQRLARTEARPAFGLWIGYQREDDATVVLGGVRVSVPVWSRGQGARAVARARSARVAVELERARAIASRQVVDALAAYQRAREAVEVLDADVVPLLDDSEALLGQSVDAGTIAVGDFLIARQELLDGRREQLDRLLALAQAAVRVQWAMGVTP